MARVAAFVPDLLFGSNVVGSLRAAGHEPVLVARSEDLKGALTGACCLVVDLTDDVAARIEAVAALAPRPPVLAFYSHVEADVRAAALEAGFELVIPRSRMAREGAALVTRLAA